MIGWARRTAQQIEGADKVVVACTEAYKRWFDTEAGDDEEDERILRQVFNDARYEPGKFIPIVFSDSDVKHIPDCLNALPFYQVTSDMEFALLRESLMRARPPASKGVLPLRITAEEIARRAHKRWIENGCPNGQAMQDWLDAERELKVERGL